MTHQIMGLMACNALPHRILLRDVCSSVSAVELYLLRPAIRHPCSSDAGNHVQFPFPIFQLLSKRGHSSRFETRCG